MYWDSTSITHNKEKLSDKLNNLEHYSTEETFTGKYWIDGKKIYRKVLTGTFTGDNENDINIAYLGTVNIVSMQGTINNGSFIFPINNYYGLSTEYWVSTFYDNYTGYLKMNAGNKYTDDPYIVIVEYIKTTE